MAASRETLGGQTSRRAVRRFPTLTPSDSPGLLRYALVRPQGNLPRNAQPKPENLGL
jgi:hypothetical protein